MNYDRCEDDGFIIRGKAISKLELMRCNSEWNEDFNKALDLAIKVLRQMGGEDLISRQQAIDDIKANANSVTDALIILENFPPLERESGEEKSCKGCKHLCDPFGNACNQCVRALEDNYESEDEE